MPHGQGQYDMNALMTIADCALARMCANMLERKRAMSKGLRAGGPLGSVTGGGIRRDIAIGVSRDAPHFAFRPRHSRHLGWDLAHGRWVVAYLSRIGWNP